MNVFDAYDYTALLTIEGKAYSHHFLPRPGDLVRYYLQQNSSIGLVVGSGNEAHTFRVLWASKLPVFTGEPGFIIYDECGTIPPGLPGEVKAT